MKDYNQDITSSKLYKEASDVPASQIGPETVITSNQELIQSIQNITDTFANKESSKANRYNEGKFRGRAGRIDRDYIDILNDITANVFNVLRSDIAKQTKDIEEQQISLEKLTAIEDGFKSQLKILKTCNFKLDKTALLCIMHGYLNESIIRCNSYGDQ